MVSGPLFTLEKGGEGSSCVQVFVNGTAGADQTPYSNAQGQIHFEHARGEPIPGTFRVWDRLLEVGRSWTTVGLTAGGSSPWQSVTREAMLKAAIEHAEGKDGAVLTTLHRARSETGYRRWLADTPQRKAAWDATAAALPPAEAAKARRQFEQVERETTESLKVGEASELEEIDRELARITQWAGRWRARITAMSPAERNAPAWLHFMDASGEFLFVEPESATSFQVVQEKSRLPQGPPLADRGTLHHGASEHQPDLRDSGGSSRRLADLPEARLGGAGAAAGARLELGPSRRIVRSLNRISA